jgi:hypothetical protein
VCAGRKLTTSRNSTADTPKTNTIPKASLHVLACEKGQTERGVSVRTNADNIHSSTVQTSILRRATRSYTLTRKETEVGTTSHTCCKCKFAQCTAKPLGPPNGPSCSAQNDETKIKNKRTDFGRRQIIGCV